jgi:hypothetical protein
MCECADMQMCKFLVNGNRVSEMKKTILKSGEHDKSVNRIKKTAPKFE